MDRIMEKLNEPLKTYFSHSTQLYDKWLKLRSSCLKSVNRIQNLSEQFHLVKRTKLIVLEGENAEEMEEKLLGCMRMHLIQEMEEFDGFRKEMATEVHLLERLQSKIDKLTEGLNLKQEPENPIPYHVLLEQMHITFRYYQGSYAKTNAAFNLLDYEDQGTIDVLKETVGEEEVPPDFIKMADMTLLE